MKSSPASELRRLQPDHADDHRQVVLDPVLDLGELHLHRLEPALGGRLAGALGAEEVGHRGPRRGTGVIVRRLRNGVPSARWLVISMAMSSPAGDRRADARDPVGLGRRALQEAAVAAERGLDRVAGQPGEGGVGVDDRVVLEAPGWSAPARAAGPTAPLPERWAGAPGTMVTLPLMRRGRCAARCASRAAPCRMRCTKMPGVWMPSGSRLPSGTISSTSATQTLPQVAAFGLKLRAVLR